MKLLTSQVVSYSQECQALLESPMQAIFTLTLILLGYLPTPIEDSSDEEWIIRNSYGQEISGFQLKLT